MSRGATGFRLHRQIHLDFGRIPISLRRTTTPSGIQMTRQTRTRPKTVMLAWPRCSQTKSPDELERDGADHRTEDGSQPTEHGHHDGQHGVLDIESRERFDVVQKSGMDAARRSGEEGADDEHADLQGGGIDPETARGGLVFPYGDQQQAEVRAGKEHGRQHDADREQEDGVVLLGQVSREDGNAGAAARKRRQVFGGYEHPGTLGQGQHGDREIGPANAQQRIAYHRRDECGDEPARQVARDQSHFEVDEADHRGVHAEPDEQDEAEIDIAGKAGEEVPGPGEADVVEGQEQQGERRRAQIERRSTREDRVDDQAHGTDDGNRASPGHGRINPPPRGRANLVAGRPESAR